MDDSTQDGDMEFENSNFQSVLKLPVFGPKRRGATSCGLTNLDAMSTFRPVGSVMRGGTFATRPLAGEWIVAAGNARLT